MEQGAASLEAGQGLWSLLLGSNWISPANHTGSTHHRPQPIVASCAVGPKPPPASRGLGSQPRTPRQSRSRQSPSGSKSQQLHRCKHWLVRLLCVSWTRGQGGRVRSRRCFIRKHLGTRRRSVSSCRSPPGSALRATCLAEEARVRAGTSTGGKSVGVGPKGVRGPVEACSDWLPATGARGCIVIIIWFAGY